MRTSSLRIVIVAIALVAPWHSKGQSAERFEVASVRISQPGATGSTSWKDSDASAFTATNIPLHILVQMAYSVNEKQISGEDRLGTNQYDISARPEGGGILTQDRLKPMLQALLTERFGLVTHREAGTVSGYALVTAKGGSKLTASSGSRAGRAAVLRGRLIGIATNMPVFASMLAGPLGAPVVDRTGIEGSFDIDLKFAPEDSTDTSLPSLFTAVQEQLGLKLESHKVPLERLVIDHCQQIPTGN